MLLKKFTNLDTQKVLTTLNFTQFSAPHEIFIFSKKIQFIHLGEIHVKSLVFGLDKFWFTAS